MVTMASPQPQRLPLSRRSQRSQRGSLRVRPLRSLGPEFGLLPAAAGGASAVFFVGDQQISIDSY